MSPARKISRGTPFHKIEDIVLSNACCGRYSTRQTWARSCHACEKKYGSWDSWIKHFNETEEIYREHVVWAWVNERL